MSERASLEGQWLELIRRTLPSLAGPRGWPVRYDHCFARILLDQICGGCWYDHIAGRPAYKQLTDEQLRSAIALAEALVAGQADLHALNAASLGWRSDRRRRVEPGLI
jgi:hypothetical protein